MGSQLPDSLRILRLMRPARFLSAVLATTLMCPHIAAAQPAPEPTPAPAVEPEAEPEIEIAPEALIESTVEPTAAAPAEPELPPWKLQGSLTRVALELPAPPPPPPAPALPPAQLADTTPLTTWDDVRGQVISASILGGLHASLYTWAYFAWYRPRNKYEQLTFLNEGWFGPNTYAGGADKLGHFYSNYVFVRGSVGLLEAGGWERRPALIASTALTMAFFTVIEFKDGYHQGFGFSVQDMVANLAGNAVGVLLLGWPEIDRAFDVRIQYFPTHEFLRELRQGVVDAAEDYSGQAFVLAHHLGAIGPLRRSRYLGWTRYVDVVLGYRALNYKPVPDDPAASPRAQELYLGLTLDMQAVLGAWRDNVSRDSGWSRVLGTTQSFFEFYQLPYTTLKLVSADRDNGPLPVE